jgi:hypothetical protein
MRPTVRALVLLWSAVGGLTLLSAACGSNTPEQQILRNFFRAARVRDNATIAAISAVTFNARTDGIVQDFEVTNMGEEQRRALQLRQLIDEEEKATQAGEEVAKKKRAYQDANLAAIQRVIGAERSGTPVTGSDAAVRTAWNKWVEDQAQVQRRISEARAKLTSERAQAVNSLTPPSRPDVDVSSMEDVELITKQVTVNAQVQMPDGQTVPKTMLVTLQRAVGKQGNQNMQGRWIITSIRDQGAPAPTS